jgi:hypothetical protein
MWAQAIAVGIIIMLLTGFFALFVAICAKIDAYHRLNGDGPLVP